VLNLVFAAAYLACGPDALLLSGASSLGGPVSQAFFFSVETFATIGYGQIAVGKPRMADLDGGIDEFGQLQGSLQGQMSPMSGQMHSGGQPSAGPVAPIQSVPGTGGPVVRR
jgi:hypothetical protein